MSIEYVAFEKAFVSEAVGRFKIKESEYSPSGLIKVVDQGQSLVSGFTDQVDLIRKNIPYIVFGDHTKAIKFVDFQFVVGADGVRLYKPAEGFDAEFLFFFLRSANLPSDGYGRHSKYLNDLCVPKIDLENQLIITAQIKVQLAEVEAARKALQCQQQEIVNLANTLIRASLEQSVGAGHARDLSHGDDPSRARPAPTEWQQQEIVNLANTLIRASLEQSVGAGHARDLSHGDDHSRARPAPTEWQQQEIVNLANSIIRASIEQSVGAGHARDLSHGDDPSRARPAPTSVTEIRLGEVLEEIKKGIGETWADYPVLGATRGGLAPAKEQPGKYPQRYKPVSCGTVFYNPMRILIGSIAFVDDDDEPGITSPDYVALRGKPGLVDSRWFYYWLRSPYGEHCINSLARGAVRERMLFNRLAEGSILLPSYPEQLRASKALATLKSMKSAIQKQLNDLDKIPERLLAQAFEKI